MTKTTHRYAVQTETGLTEIDSLTMLDAARDFARREHLGDIATVDEMLTRWIAGGGLSIWIEGPMEAPDGARLSAVAE